MGPDRPLPYDDPYFESTDAYVDSLLDLLGANELLQTLCGGVHLLDFITSTPDLYSRVLPYDWRVFFDEHDMADLLDLFMRENIDQFDDDPTNQWRDGPSPPASLIAYLSNVRKHLLNRSLSASQCAQNRTQKKLAKRVAVGMNVKKVHEVGLYAAYIDELATSIKASGQDITHLVDFGSGQNYLGRALASEPYNRDIVAIESRTHNSERAKDYDVQARLVEKNRVIRNKKAHRNGGEEPAKQAAPPRSSVAQEKWPDLKRSDAVQYIDHRIHDGDLSAVIPRIASSPDEDKPKNIMIISLHSCGNLVHHGLRSLILNPEVKAVALVGCCYNLLTERLGPATYKLPELRPSMHLYPRLRNPANGDTEGEVCDPHGFPMSRRLCNAYDGQGVRLNITARMMAVQAPQNWGRKDSESFFTRHFYRALLQRILLDYGVVGPPSKSCAGGVSPVGHSSGGTPIIIGSLRKVCYESFIAYVRGAFKKLCADDAPNPALGELIVEKMGDISDGELEEYEQKYAPSKKYLSVMWSLMSFSAGVVEAAIVVDRWLWLKEQEEVGEAWVEPVFEYGVSPRNLVVVAVKK